MAKYTVTLLELGELKLKDRVTYSTAKNVFDVLEQWLFDFDYPIYTDAHRKEFQGKFIRHYLMYEIGQETPAMFKLFLQSRLLDIMPYYNLLYKISDLLEEIDLLKDRDMHYDEDGNATRYDQTTRESNKDNGGQRMEDRNDKHENLLHDEHSDHTDDNLTKSGDLVHEYDETKSLTAGQKETTQYGKIDTQTDVSQIDNISQGNSANSNFPQANVFNNQNAYYSSGQEANQQVQQNKDATLTNKMTGNDVVSHSGVDTESHTGSTTDKYSNMKDDRIVDTSGNSDKTDTGESSGTTDVQELYKELYSALDELRQVQKHHTGKHEYGLTGNRSIAQMLGEVVSNYVNVDLAIINACRDLFMLVY